MDLIPILLLVFQIFVQGHSTFSFEHYRKASLLLDKAFQSIYHTHGIQMWLNLILNLPKEAS